MLQAEVAILGEGHPNLVASRKAQVTHFKQIVASIVPDPEATAAMYEELKEDNTTCPFTTEERTSIAEAISVHTRAGHVVADVNDKQTHMFSFNYLTDGLWGILGNPDYDLDHKLNELASFAINVMGLVKGNDNTCRLLTALALEASRMTLNPPQNKAKVAQLKKYMKNIRELTQPIPTFNEFPENVSEFVSAYPSKYPPGSPPVQCPLDTKKLREMCRPDVIPTRNSANSIKMPGSACSNEVPALFTQQQQQQQQFPMGMNPMMLQNCVGMFAQMMQLMSTGVANNRSQDEPCPLQYFFNGQQTQRPLQDATRDVVPAPRQDMLPVAGGALLPALPPTSVAAPTDHTDVRSKVHEVLLNKKTKAKEQKGKKGKKAKKDEESENDSEESDSDATDASPKTSKKRPAGKNANKKPSHALKKPSGDLGVSDPDDISEDRLLRDFPQFFSKKDARDATSFGAFTTKASKAVGKLIGKSTCREAYALAAKVHREVHGA